MKTKYFGIDQKEEAGRLSLYEMDNVSNRSEANEVAGTSMAGEGVGIAVSEANLRKLYKQIADRLHLYGM